MESVGMKPGISCSVCHAPGKEESDKAVFVTQMTPSAANPGAKTYGRCDSCHVVAGGGSDD
jgi:cytochrome c2